MRDAKNLRELATWIIESRDVDYCLRVLRFQIAWGAIVCGGVLSLILLIANLILSR